MAWALRWHAVILLLTVNVLRACHLDLLAVIGYSLELCPKIILFSFITATAMRLRQFPPSIVSATSMHECMWIHTHAYTYPVLKSGDSQLLITLAPGVPTPMASKGSW